MRIFEKSSRAWFFLLVQFPSIVTIFLLHNDNGSQRKLSNPRLFATGQEDFTCDTLTDFNCESTEDGVCDSNLGANPKPGCETGDCIDCNSFCQQYNYDCQGCLNAIGCFYCPADALCYNLQYYVSSTKEQSCTRPVDWISSTETTPDQCSFSTPDTLFE